MTDPGRSDPVHLDERRVRNDLSDVFADVLADVVAGAWSAPSCPSLARLTAAVPDGFDTGELTPFQQDEVLDGCHHCGRCVEADRAYDLPQAIVRGQAMRRATGQLRSGERVPRWVVGGGRLGVLGRRVLGAAPGSAWRRVGATVGGLSSIRHLPAPADRPLRSMRPTNDQHRNPLHHTGHRTGQNTGRHQPGRHQHGQHRHDRHDGSLRDVVIVPTCGIDRFAPHVATDLIDLLHRAGVHVAIASEVRCGHAWWEAGDLRRFARMSSDAVETLIPFVDAGAEVVVLEATCHRALLTAAEHVAPSSRSAADRIAARTVGLDRLIGRLDRQFPFDPAVRPTTVLHHRPVVVGSSPDDHGVRDVFERLGSVVECCSAPSGGTWALRAVNDVMATVVIDHLIDSIRASTAEHVVSDCPFAAAEIESHTGRAVAHPIEVVAGTVSGRSRGQDLSGR